MSDPTSSIPEGEASTQSEEELQRELEAELQKQIERHEAAVKLAKQREQEAKQAKERAAASQKTMQEMQVKYEVMRRKLDLTRNTLKSTTSRVEHQYILKQKLDALRAKAEAIAKLQSDRNERRRQNKIDYAQTVELLQEKLKSCGSESKEGACATIEEEEQQEEEVAEAEDKTEVDILEFALRKEEEAKAMKKKVEETMRLLEERKQKLKQTESAIQTKADEVAKVEKLIHSKERRANYVEKKRMEELLFGRSTKK